MTTHIRITGLVAAMAATVSLAACSSSGSPSAHPSMTPMTRSTSTATSQAAASAAHNDADVTFATDMIPHHTQALEMATLALSRTHNPQVRALATQIKAEQSPEITSMTGWLRGWGTPVPAASAGGSMGGMSMGGASMGGSSAPGMMSDADMHALTAATGTAFDRLFLAQMITHHRGAIAMARTELAHGRYAAATRLASSIIAGQSREIATMTALLRTIR